MINSLINICKKKLDVNESVSVIEIVDFLEKNNIYDLRFLSLLNFKGKRATSLNSKLVQKNHFHEILGFKKMYDENDDVFYHIYCRVLQFANSGKKNEYKKYISNKNLTQKLNLISHEEKLDSKIILYPSDNLYSLFFIPGELKSHRGEIYREIKNP